MLIAACIAYAVYLGFLYFKQDWVIFPADLAPGTTGRPPAANAVVLQVATDDGPPIYAWFLPVDDTSPDTPRPAVIFYHGNAEIIDQWLDLADDYHRLGCSVLLPEFRGYGKTGGKPSRDAIRADMLDFYDQLANRPDVDPRRIVLHGRSLGGAIATEVAGKRAPAALILESTFTNLDAMAHRFFSPGFLSRHRYHTDEIIAELDMPILIFHGRIDGLVPVRMGRELHRLAKDSTLVEYDCGHNDLPGTANADDYWKHIAELLRQHDILRSSD